MNKLVIYSQSITGKFRTLKNYGSYLLLAIYFLCSWIRWDRGADLPSQAILMDLPNRKAYLFGIEIWPDEVYYIAGLLMLAALGLFFVTSLFGRIWCGYTCPHTVFVDLFIKAEAYFQGDRNARMKLDQQEWTNEKIKKKLQTHVVWVLIAFSFAFGWVCYFYDAPELFHDVLTFQVSGGALAWLVGLTASTYFIAGFIREKVCVYMCPYGRFQSAMLDNDSSVVTYHDWRGEPRGKFDESGELGDCIDCGKCVVVCPMGIDIRDGLQLPCIGCGLCIDACNSVMEKLNRPLDLIGYDSTNGNDAKRLGKTLPKNIFRMKTVLFALVFVIVSAVMFYSLVNKTQFSMSVIRDRGALFTVLPDGSYRNIYIVKFANRTAQKRNYILTVKGLDDFIMKCDLQTEYQEKVITVELLPEEEKEMKIFVKSSKLSDAQKIIHFSLTDVQSNKTFDRESTFVTE
jgi:cytochrome c oxidase accessory protein FixG